MRSYTIVKALALCFGALSVVARSLPERRSELSANADRGFGSGNHGRSNVEDAGDTGAEVDTAMSKATGTTDIDHLKKHLQSFVKVSEAVVNGKVHKSTYSIPADPTFLKRDTTFPKRDTNLVRARCYTSCANPPGVSQPTTDDCTELYNNIYSMDGEFSVDPQQAVHYTYGNCGSLFVNDTADTVTYDFWDLAGTTKYLNGFCIARNQASYGSCKFGDLKTDLSISAYVLVVPPSYFGE